MSSYKALNKQIFSRGEYKLTPIRFEDRFLIMKWRNEQIYHLRQNEPLTTVKQDWYFDNIVANLFEQDQPDQILFSFLKNDVCIGYGGLVHINWIDQNAEISFIMDTRFEAEFFETNWTNYLNLLETMIKENLALHKIYVYAFDLRPHLYDVLALNNFFMDARLKDHCLFKQEYIDVVIYSKLL